mmetsp:Transcript_9229/g.16770  ORF Transcript_9229/g.16770 Transcript_9229/m.16770 type:complete len:241 (+) Transcript_9229:198-920(+)
MMLVSWNGKENNIKVVLLGESGVGKSSLAVRFVSNEYRPYIEGTVGANYYSKSVELNPSNADPKTGACSTNTETTGKTPRHIRIVTFKIWDTAGQERFHSLVPMYYRGAGAAILIFDLSKPESLHSLRVWAKELKENGPPGIILALCGNKSDLTSERRVDRKTAEEFALEFGALYMEASAREGTNVNELFQNIARRVAAADEAAVSVTMCACSQDSLMLGSLEDAVSSIQTATGAKRTCC